jgi:hypothetical protein
MASEGRSSGTTTIEFSSKTDDRGTSSGPNVWNLTQADGAIAGTDFFAILAQFGHDCT